LIFVGSVAARSEIPAYQATTKTLAPLYYSPIPGDNGGTRGGRPAQSNL
jgi:hypothetical protein